MSDRRIDTSVFAVLVLIVLVVLGQSGLAFFQLRQQEHQLRAQFESQTAQIVTAQRLREQLDGIAGSVARLAEEGHANAILVRDQLQAQGIQIRPPGQ